MIIAYCAICSYVCVIHFLLSINADDDPSKKKIQKLEREQGWNVFWNFSAWLIDVIISLDKPNIMFTTNSVPKLYIFFLHQQNLQACPCVSGYVCNVTNNVVWGKCQAVDGGSGSGLGSDDFWVTSSARKQLFHGFKTTSVLLKNGRFFWSFALVKINN